MDREIVLLGSQRRPSVQHVVSELEPGARIATVTAGWQEREPDDAELAELLGHRAVNLALYARWQSLLEKDREYAVAEREHDAALEELRQLYLTQLDHALDATYEIAVTKEPRPRFRDRVLADSLELVRAIDEQHLVRVRDAHLEFYDVWRPHERAEVAAHREEVREILQSADAVTIAGGHVGVLARVLHLFHVEPHLPGLVVAWSAGAMALTERVVLFHDYVPHGVAQTELMGEGIGLLTDLVPLPDARRRLRVNDPVRMAVLARRFAPAQCVVLDDGVRVRLVDGHLPPDARVVDRDGRIAPLEAA
jgi:hypothetical protein